MKHHFRPGRILTNLRQHWAAPACFSLLACVAFSVLAFFPYSSSREYTELSNLLQKLSEASFLALVLSTAGCALRSRIKYSNPLSWLIGISVFALCFVCDYMPLLQALLFFGVIVSVWGASGRTASEARLNQICGWFFASLGMSIVVCIALSVLQSAVVSLFFDDLGYRITAGIRDTMLCISFLLFAPWMFLGGLPDEAAPSDTRGAFCKFNYRVLLPLSLLLMAILLAYVGKIVITWTMPVGTMNGYALAALALFTFFHLTLTGDENAASAFFVRWCPWLMLPILTAQQVGVWIRVEAYGLTAARIYGIIGTILFAGVMVTALLHRKARWFLPAAALAALVFIGTPLNAENIARLEQEARLEAALMRNNMLAEDGSIIANADANPEDKTIIYDAAHYLARQENAPAGSLTAQLQARLNNENNMVQYWNDVAWHDVLGFIRPSDVPAVHSVSYQGSAAPDRIVTAGYAFAEWMGIYHSIDLNASAEQDADTGPFRFTGDMQRVFELAAAADGVPAIPDGLMTAVIYDEAVDFGPLLRTAEVSTVASNGSINLILTDDVLHLPSGRIYHISDINIYPSTYSNLLTLIVNGWLLSPEIPE